MLQGYVGVFLESCMETVRKNTEKQTSLFLERPSIAGQTGNFGTLAELPARRRQFRAP